MEIISIVPFARYVDAEGYFRPRNAHEACWMYACTCAASVHTMSGTFYPGEKAFIEHCIKNRALPSREQIERWLPAPYRWLLERGMPQTKRAVLWYWRTQHTKGLSPVRSARITNVLLDGEAAEVHVSANQESETVLNVHGYPIERGYRVYTHAGIIAEVGDE